MALRLTQPITTTASRVRLDHLEVDRRNRKAEGRVVLIDDSGTIIRRHQIVVDITLGNGSGDMSGQLANALEAWFFDAAVAQGKIGAGSIETD